VDIIRTSSYIHAPEFSRQMASPRLIQRLSLRDSDHDAVYRGHCQGHGGLGKEHGEKSVSIIADATALGHASTLSDASGGLKLGSFSYTGEKQLEITLAGPI